jgi:hypothetical protein
LLGFLTDISEGDGKVEAKRRRGTSDAPPRERSRHWLTRAQLAAACTYELAGTRVDSLKQSCEGKWKGRLSRGGEKRRDTLDAEARDQTDFVGPVQPLACHYRYFIIAGLMVLGTVPSELSSYGQPGVYQPLLLRDLAW